MQDDYLLLCILANQPSLIPAYFPFGKQLLPQIISERNLITGVSHMNFWLDVDRYGLQLEALPRGEDDYKVSESLPVNPGDGCSENIHTSSFGVYYFGNSKIREFLDGLVS